MTVSPTNTATNPAAATGAAATQTKTDLARNKLSDTYDNFLKLLTTQLQYQDPMAPMDSAQFTNQLVMYSQVEQQIGQNEKLEKLLKLQNASQTQASLGFIGLDVEVDGNQFAFDGSKPVKIAYELEGPAAKSKLIITDAKGSVVQEVEASKIEGKAEFQWDGKTRGGGTAPAGLYTVKIAALDGADEAVKTSTTLYGRVSGIETDKGETILLMGDVRLKMEQVRSARDSSQTPAAMAA